MTGSYKMNKYSSRRESGPFQFSSQREGIRDRLPIANSHRLFSAPGNFMRAFDVCLASNYCNYLIKKSPRVPIGFTFFVAPCAPLFPLPWTTHSSLSLSISISPKQWPHMWVFVLGCHGLRRKFRCGALFTCPRWKLHKNAIPQGISY